ncbi:energy-coupling factor ABC transporter permease [Candidatus Woesearchaeota archaeon]|nr:energy-coupling factor ABC transporter permease [Candidatus Woesearchaeota archaeon]
MHIPDGFLSLPVSIACLVIVILFWIIAFSRAKKVMGEKHVPLLAVIAAAIFGGQMLNFTLIGIGGTSGHLIGAALVAILLGPYAAIIVLTLVLLVQALVFADGGVVVFGANVLLMGVVGGLFGYMIYFLTRKTGIAISSFLAGFTSVVAASIVCSVLLGLSGTIEMSRALIAMVPIHMIIGIGEGFITMGIVLYFQKTRPDILKLKKV